MKMKWFSTTHLENEELSENYLIFSTIEVLGWIHSNKDIFTIVANMGKLLCDELTCSGWVRSPYCSTRCPSRGSGHALGSGPLGTVSPQHCSGTQPGYGRIPVDWQRGEKRGKAVRWLAFSLC